jgi:polyhydroxyalkanoate synthesis regulator phasin
MTTLLEKIRKTLEEKYDYFRDNANTVMERAEDFGRISMLKFEIKQMSASVERKLAVLGDAVFPHLLSGDLSPLQDNPAVKLVLEEIQELNRQIDAKHKEMNQIIQSNETEIRLREHGEMKKRIEELEKEIEDRMADLDDAKKAEKPRKGTKKE